MSAPAFHPGSIIVLTLGEPRQKLFGLLLELEAKGVVISGVQLESLDDLGRIAASGEPVTVSTLFFPMHRVERMELDSSEGEVPSLAESFAARTGRTVAQLFGQALPR